MTEFLRNQIADAIAVGAKGGGATRDVGVLSSSFIVMSEGRIPGGLHPVLSDAAACWVDGESYISEESDWTVSLVLTCPLDLVHKEEMEGGSPDAKRGERADSAPLRGAALTAELQRVKGEIARLLDCIDEVQVEDYELRFQQFESIARTLDEPIVNALESWLARLARELGPSAFGDFEANREFVKRLRELLRRFDLQVICPACGEPATFVCAASTSPTGVFSFRHRSGAKGTSHRGTASLPHLRLVAGKASAER